MLHTEPTTIRLNTSDGRRLGRHVGSTDELSGTCTLGSRAIHVQAIDRRLVSHVRTYPTYRVRYLSLVGWLAGWLVGFMVCAWCVAITVPVRGRSGLVAEFERRTPWCFCCGADMAVCVRIDS